MAKEEKEDKNPLREFFRTTSLACAVGGIIATFPYYLPTSARAMGEHQTSPQTLPLEDSISGAIGFFAGIGGLFSQGYLYLNAAQRGQWEWLLLPVATNIISDVYEIYRMCRD